MSADPRLGLAGIDSSLQQATTASPSLAHLGQSRARLAHGPEHAASTQHGGLQPSSQGPISGHPHVPPNHPRSQALSSNSVSAPSPPQSDNAHLPLGAPGSTLPHGSLPQKLHGNIRDSPDYRELSSAMKKARPEVARQVIRDFRNKCLLGSDRHLTFIIATISGSADDETLARGAEESGEAVATSLKKTFIQNLKREDFDKLADVIYAKATNDFLDKGMARRLETIQAQPLVNALARAERLGYHVGDIVEENAANGAEHVVPSFHPIQGTTHPSQPVPSQPVPSQPVSSHLVPSQPIPSQHGKVPPTMPPQSHALQPEVLGTVRNLPLPTPAGPPGQYGIVHCSRCGRPCSGEQAFAFHSGRAACEHTHKVDRIGKDICAHCGSQFTSSGGLTYHMKSNVCGKYDDIALQTVLAELHARFPRPSGSSSSGPPPQTQNQPTPNARQTPTEQAGGTPVYTPAGRSTSTPLSDQYSNLTPEQRRSFDFEMKRAEEKYGALMQEAMKLPTSERIEELQKLANRFNTKQSTTRKKYGIRLRVRRSQAEIEAERNRLFAASGGRPSSGTAEHQQRQKRAYGSAEQGDPDRDREGSMPRKKQAPGDLSSGLPGASAAAERLGTTQSITPSKPRGSAQVPQQVAAARGTSDDPMQIDDSSGTDGSGLDSNDDIPARLPAQKG